MRELSPLTHHARKVGPFLPRMNDEGILGRLCESKNVTVSLPLPIPLRRGASQGYDRGQQQWSVRAPMKSGHVERGLQSAIVPPSGQSGCRHSIRAKYSSE